MDTEVLDQHTAVTKLRAVRDKLVEAVLASDRSSRALRDGLVDIRPKGLLTVDEMADAIGRDRNYVDSVWSLYGDADKGKQTRVAVTESASAEAARRAYDSLAAASVDMKKAKNLADSLRAERNRLVALVYGSKILGPSDIGREVGVDRNHVLRIARKLGIKPVHREDARNQYTAK